MRLGGPRTRFGGLAIVENLGGEGTELQARRARIRLTDLKLELAVADADGRAGQQAETLLGLDALPSHKSAVSRAEVFDLQRAAAYVKYAVPRRHGGVARENEIAFGTAHAKAIGEAVDLAGASVDEPVLGGRDFSCGFSHRLLIGTDER